MIRGIPIVGSREEMVTALFRKPTSYCTSVACESDAVRVCCLQSSATCPGGPVRVPCPDSLFVGAFDTHIVCVSEDLTDAAHKVAWAKLLVNPRESDLLGVAEGSLFAAVSQCARVRNGRVEEESCRYEVVAIVQESDVDDLLALHESRSEPVATLAVRLAAAPLAPLRAHIIDETRCVFARRCCKTADVILSLRHEQEAPGDALAVSTAWGDFLGGGVLLNHISMFRDLPLKTSTKVVDALGVRNLKDVWTIWSKEEFHRKRLASGVHLVSRYGDGTVLLPPVYAFLVVDGSCTPWEDRRVVDVKAVSTNVPDLLHELALHGMWSDAGSSRFGAIVALPAFAKQGVCVETLRGAAAPYKPSAVGLTTSFGQPAPLTQAWETSTQDLHMLLHSAPVVATNLTRSSILLVMTMRVVPRPLHLTAYADASMLSSCIEAAMLWCPWDTARNRKKQQEQQQQQEQEQQQEQQNAIEHATRVGMLDVPTVRMTWRGFSDEETLYSLDEACGRDLYDRMSTVRTVA